MERSAIFHRPGNNYSFIIEKDTLCIRIRTKKADIQKIELIYGDPYVWENDKWIFQRADISKSATDALFDYWEVKISPPHRRIRYGFELYSNDERVLFTEKGFYEDIIYDSGYYFCFPYLHASEQFNPPEWVKDTVWYQIFPDRFFNGDKLNDPKDVQPWGKVEPSANNFFGGDLKGIEQKLDYLVTLGINGIYLTPIFTAPTNHKYDTIDYFSIDPQFGTKEDLKSLVESCHARGIKVMLDAVFNHCGFYFPPFQDVLEKGSESEFVDWFYPHSLPLQKGERPNYEAFAFVPQMPKLNTQNPHVKKYLLDVAAYWIKEFDIDGWRLDVANEVDHQFWREFRYVVRNEKPDIYILGEVWHDSMPWLYGDQFDAVMNYPFTTNVLQLFASQKMSAMDFMDSMTSVVQSYPNNVMDVTFNLVGSHDTSRILTECQDDVRRVKLIYLLMYTSIGSPCMYYGDELGMTGGQDPGCRACMEWEEGKQNTDLLAHVTKCISLRKQHPLLANDGQFQFMNWIDTNLVVYRKYVDDRNIFVLINPTNTTQSYQVPFEIKNNSLKNLWTDEEIVCEPFPQIQLEPYDFKIVEFHTV
ncbi:glycoside hydrolase family 13 protein [Paenisporosarcina quisquiliarum]|uniref:Glycoside hydrolase family 13 protein n=1 Tax=Paenisporosarcina quisquiliarum TaxID=365346 RepID=A0A9X3LF41_9BACL|nr:glycoside hydrolase family 13 protein [Paenisporosarcina quisquiliarum]MCZ8536134.1 glycoside hydrolase family 13 protein [Paenisporosarcina quisquiliarum]